MPIFHFYCCYFFFVVCLIHRILLAKCGVCGLTKPIREVEKKNNSENCTSRHTNESNKKKKITTTTSEWETSISIVGYRHHVVVVVVTFFFFTYKSHNVCLSYKLYCCCCRCRCATPRLSQKLQKNINYMSLVLCLTSNCMYLAYASRHHCVQMEISIDLLYACAHC